MSPSRHVAFRRIAFGDINYAVEKVCFAVLATEILYSVRLDSGNRGFGKGVGRSSGIGRSEAGGSGGAYPTDDVFMVAKMSFAVLASVDFVAV
jgi:hypothetical protein